MEKALWSTQAFSLITLPASAIEKRRYWMTPGTGLLRQLLLLSCRRMHGLIEPTQFALAEADLRLFDRLPPPDYPLHLIAAENHVQMRRRGITIPTIDTLIVTMAQAAGCPLLTRDRRQRDLARSLKVRLESLHADPRYLRCPSVLQLCQMGGLHDRMLEIARGRGDLLTYAAARIQQ